MGGGSRVVSRFLQTLVKFFDRNRKDHDHSASARFNMLKNEVLGIWGSGFP